MSDWSFIDRLLMNKVGRSTHHCVLKGKLKFFGENGYEEKVWVVFAQTEPFRTKGVANSLGYRIGSRTVDERLN